MNPRILKKLCKRIVKMGHPIAKGAWLDDDDTIGSIYIGNCLLGDRLRNATAWQKRRHYMARTTISSIYVVGGGADYWGEAIDPETVYHAASSHVLWKVWTLTKCVMRDERGEVIDEVEGWPETNKRLTGQFVIGYLRTEMKSTGGR